MLITYMYVPVFFGIICEKKKKRKFKKNNLTNAVKSEIDFE